MDYVALLDIMNEIEMPVRKVKYLVIDADGHQFGACSIYHLQQILRTRCGVNATKWQTYSLLNETRAKNDSKFKLKLAQHGIAVMHA